MHKFKFQLKDVDELLGFELYKRYKKEYILYFSQLYHKNSDNHLYHSTKQSILILFYFHILVLSSFEM